MRSGREITGAVVLLAALVPLPLFERQGDTSTRAPDANGPYARIAFLRPHDGDTVDFESGYVRHLDFHRKAADPWAWYGWTIWAGDRQRWFVYATFGHSADSLDTPVSPTDDERDNISNVTPHAEFMGNGLYEYLPALSRGTGVPSPSSRLELATVSLHAGSEAAFEAALSEIKPGLQGETLWYRMIAGGRSPRFVRLRPHATLSALLRSRNGADLPDKVNHLIATTVVEILTFRPAMSYGVSPDRQ